LILEKGKSLTEKSNVLMEVIGTVLTKIKKMILICHLATLSVIHN